MKIAIISSYSWIKRENNYGALLQYYALQKHLTKQGHQVYWIRYNPVTKMSKSRSKFRFFLSKLKRQFVAILKKEVTYQIKQCFADFEKFLENEINLSQHEYKTLEGLKLNPPEADIFITGSDQVWLGLTKANYLDFVSNNKLKFSYGASFGKNIIAEDIKEEVKNYLNQFNKISVREKEGLDICKELGRKDAIQVIDPTMILDKSEYLQFKNTPVKNTYKKFIMCYFLNVYNSSNIYFNQIEEYTKQQKLNLQVVPVQGSEYIFPSRFIKMPSPESWLFNINNAEGIITNSFHGTVFSIIMRRPFLVFLQSGSSSVQNCRFFSLLKRLGLESRIYNPNKPIHEQMKSEINWDNVIKEQQAFRETSIEFLDSCIKEIEITESN